ASIGIAFDADGVGAMALLDIVVPQRRRFADMTVGVDDPLCHLFPPGSLARLCRPLNRRKENRMARRPIRIAVLHFAPETVTFLKNDTTLEDFIYEGSPASGEALLAYDTKSYMGGFVKV